MMKRYRYLCICKNGVEVSGIYRSEQTDRDYITDAVLLKVSQTVVESKVPWDPFNIQLLVKAQNEPKP